MFLVQKKTSVGCYGMLIKKKKDKDPFNSRTEASNSSDDEVVPKLKLKFSLEDIYSWIEKALLWIKR